MTDKKILSVSMVKNEIDIIESFVRYNLNIFDGMIIQDNNSTDGTLETLKLLKNEGLPIFIFEDEDESFDQTRKTNILLLKAIDEFRADIIVPLDADEFLISTKNNNPRIILEKIDENEIYYAKWRTYVPNFSENENEKFIPSRIKFCREEHVEEFYKVIFTTNFVKKHNAEISKGNHELFFEETDDTFVKKIKNNDLRIAHFPIRSCDQIVSKVLVGWTNALSSLDRQEGDSFHLKEMYDKIKENKIENEDIIHFAKEYSLINKNQTINIVENPIDLSFCENIEMKYTDHEIYPRVNFLENCEKISRSYLNVKKEKILQEDLLINKIKEYDQMSESYSTLKKEKILKEKLLLKKIKEYESSTSWALTSPLRKITNKIRLLKK